MLYKLRHIPHIVETTQCYKISFHQNGALGICEPNPIYDLVSVPYLIADFLLILLPVTGTATAEEDDGNNDEDQ